MKQRIIAVLLAATLGGGLAACGGNSATESAASGSGEAKADTPIIRIASGSPLSGGQASAGKDFANGAQLAVDEINAAGGVDVGGQSYHLALVSEDDAGDPKTGATVAQKTADDASIVAVVGHYNSGVTLVTTPIYARAGIPSLTVSTNPDVILKAPRFADGGTAVFRMNAHDGKQGPALAVFAQSRGVKKMAIFDDATAYGKGLADEVAKKAAELGIDTSVREAASDKTTDFKALLTKAKAAGVDGIMWGGYDDTGAILAKQARELGMSALLLMPDTACTDNYIKLAGSAAPGTICSSTSVPLGKMSGGDSFKTNYEKRFNGQTVQAYSPLSYDAVYVLADAIKAAGSTEKGKIAAAIGQVARDGLTGHLAFDGYGERKDAEIAILEEKDGKFEVIEMVK